VAFFSPATCLPHPLLFAVFSPHISIFIYPFKKLIQQQPRCCLFLYKKLQNKSKRFRKEKKGGDDFQKDAPLELFGAVV
jgi:hypothetical protein